MALPPSMLNKVLQLRAAEMEFYGVCPEIQNPANQAGGRSAMCKNSVGFPFN